MRLPTWETLAIRLRGLIAARLVAVTSALLPVLILDITLENGVPGRNFLAGWASSAYLVSLLYAVLLLRRRPHVRWQAYIQCLGDLVLITALIRFYGAFANPLSILYLVVITVASVFLRRRAGIIIATLAWISYGALLYFEIARGSEIYSAIVGQAAFSGGIHLVGFYAVAFLTSGLARNVTQAEIELQEKREDLADLRIAHRDIVSSIPSGIVTTDGAGRVSSANRAAEEILGHSEQQLSEVSLLELGLFDEQSWAELLARADANERIREDLDYSIAEEDIKQIGYAVNPLTRADGSSAGYLVIFQDLTEWRSMQEELRLKDRMAAVGEMASGLAHEVGNPLAAISGSVQMLSSAFPRQSAQHKLLDIISKESERLDRTIKGFLQFARPMARSSVRFDIAALLAQNVELLVNSPEVSNRHQVELELDPPHATLLADPDQISQIFWNLARNALRAMEEGGILRIMGKVIGESYRLQFVDSGRGMSEEERAKLFHPFRSFFDGGTGIGMAIVYRIVEEHDGRLRVESRKGAGTAITVELPGLEPVRERLTAEAQVT